MTPGLLDLRSDAALVKASLGRRPHAFEVLIGRYQNKAEAVALAIGVRPEALEDVLQDAFLRGFQNLSQLRKPDSFQAWFLQIVRNTARSSLHNRGRASLPRDLEPEDRTAADEVEMNEMRTELWRAVDSLAEGVREAVCLYYYEGGSVRSVAKTLGITRAAAKDRLRRGRDALREKMWRKFGETVRGMVPSRSQRVHRARKLGLLVISATMPEAARAGPVTEGAVPSAEGAGGGVLAGGAVMGGKKILGLVAVVILLSAVGVAVLRGDPSQEEDADEWSRPATSEAGSDTGERVKVGKAFPRALAESAKKAPDSAGTPLASVVLEAVDRDLDLFGTVVDTSGRPIAGAELRTHPVLDLRSVDPDLLEAARPGPYTRSARDGTFSLRLAQDQVVALDVAAEGFARIRLAGCNAGERLRIVLPAPCTLEVVALSKQGSPVVGADVEVDPIELHFSAAHAAAA